MGEGLPEEGKNSGLNQGILKAQRLSLRKIQQDVTITGITAKYTVG